MSYSILPEVHNYYNYNLWTPHFCYISVPQTIPVSVIPTVDGYNVLFQVYINVSR